MKNPLVLLSPSKAMASVGQYTGQINPVSAHFNQSTKAVVEAVQKLSSENIQALLKVSDAMLPRVKLSWEPKPEEFVLPENGISGLNAYQGEAFKRLDINSLSENALFRAQQSLAVLSGLYGAVTADMTILPYRLEMQSKLSVGEHANLYALWKPIITSWINEHPTPFIVNCCSGEYSKAVDWKKVNKPVIHVDFKQMSNGVAKSISVFSKQARGAMARWIFQKDIQTIFGLASFKEDGYSLFSQEEDKMIFLRE
tara:strand:+ start:4717 stop:5481 length:765 start_codon:yes stop_codon:yes gene_type:complete